ncbi:hypothetical protein [Burkholderia sp. BCC0405]|uniref:hypothetical protein n=1 Tax=Burkholderia sp. BCC0405 TaxID=2676298 RepID=UPI00158F548D|nr:hypothetical protein [Burkholderia sp. BCC0405]
MIDISKMKALLARVNDCTKPVDAADRNGIMQLVESLLSELEAREADRRWLGLELQGVIIDTEQGNGFDEVCLATIKRVREVLAR